ncbi:MAG: DUF2169 domain-containing protein [Polyangiaceae bacterium]|nr:DUF2169 domain-containing protein [Polyangiaceae bacterium]
MPGDIDGACFNVAPADQQLGELAGDERIVLDQLHSVFPRLETRLAKTVPHATLQRPGGESQDVRLRCDTLCIDTNRGLAMLVWRGTLVLTHAAERGRVTVTAEPIAPKSIARPATDEQRLDATMEFRVSRDDKPATPFVAGRSSVTSTAENPRRGMTIYIRQSRYGTRVSRRF